MSDEPPPPQLRLRPRKRDDDATPSMAGSAADGLPPPPAPSSPPGPSLPLPPPVEAGNVPPEAPPTQSPAPVPSADSAVSQDPPPVRFRLKPKLSSAATGGTAADPLAAGTPSPALPKVQPEFPPASPKDDAGGIPRLRLRMVDPAGSSQTVPGVPLAVPPIPSAIAPTVPGTMPPVGAGTQPPFAPLPSVPPVPPPPDVISLPQLTAGISPTAPTSLPPLPPRPKPVSSIPPFAPPPPGRPVARPKPKKSKRPLVLGGLALLLVVGAGAFYLTQDTAVPEPMTISAPPPPPAAKPKPAPVAETQELEGASLAPLPPQPNPFTPPAQKNASETPTNLVASPAFRAWTEDARVTGVVSGASPRAIINGRLVRPGDVVDAAGGIVFDGLDGERKLLIFRNRDGAYTTKSY